MANSEMSAALKLRLALERLLGPEIGSTDPGNAAASASGSDLAKRARARVEHRELWRQRNLDRILSEAASQLPDVDGGDDIDPDWLALFLDLAQDASNGEAQDFWARVLASEVSDSGAFHRRSLRAAARMDLWEIQGFAQLCAFVFSFESGGRFLADEDLSRVEMWSYVQGNDLIAHFVDIGLLAREVATLRLSRSPGLCIAYGNRRFRLAGLSPSTGSDESVLSYRMFSPVGQQIAAVMKPRPLFGFARNLIQALERERGIRFVVVEE